MSKEDQYIVSARKYRPATFQTVVGQRALTATLKNAITGGKLAQAYLFCGPRGVGKTSCARIFAKTINCLNPTPDGEACGVCESCKAIERGNSFNLVELDAASNNSVDDIRNITEQVNIPAQDGRYRVFIIDEVHMLSNQAFNAFLKTLEEPPKNVVFILATTERHKVIPTILSRCQIYDFRRITINDIIDHLDFVAKNEGITAEREALGVIAQKADGAMRDALSIFDQVAASTHGNVTYQGTIDALNVLDHDYYFRLVDQFHSGDVGASLLTFKEITDKGFDAQFFINGLASHLRNLMVCAEPRTVKLLEVSEDLAAKYTSQAPLMPVEWYYSALKILNDTDYAYRQSSNKRLLVELALIRLSRLLMLLSMPSQQVVIPPSGPSAPRTSTPQPAVASSSAPSTSSSPQPPASQPQSPQASQRPFVAPDGNKPQAAPEIAPEAKQNKPSAHRQSSFRISVDKETSQAPKKEDSNRPFTETEFFKAWDDYAQAHPEQRILVAAMRSSKPERRDAESYHFTVKHPAQKQAFEMVSTQLLKFLSSQLMNENVTVTVSIDEEETQSNVLPPKEFLKLVVEENPMLSDFLKALDAELE